MQLDLFLDSRAVMLANDAANALVTRDASRARTVVRELRAEAPEYPGIDVLEGLSAALGAWAAPPAERAQIERAVDWLAQNVARPAEKALAGDAPGFLAGFFRELADAARGLAYDPAWPRAHRAWLCLQCGDWQEALAAARTIPQPETTPDAIHWRCLARYRLEGIDAARADLFALAWRGPSRLQSVLVELADERLHDEWQRFESAAGWESVPPSELAAWFPAWYLVEHPAAATAFADVAFPASPPAAATRLVLELLGLEKQGHGRRLVAARARLRELNPDLFALYMANRTTRHL